MNDIFVKVNSSFKSITDLMKQKLGGGVMCPYGVGDIYITTSSTNPASKWSGTTWTQITGRFLLAAGGGYTAGNTGGSSTVTLSISQIPSHNHTYVNGGVYCWNIGNGMNAPAWGNWAQDGYSTTGTVTGSQGGSGAHNNMPPYLVVYMWKRTA